MTLIDIVGFIILLCLLYELVCFLYRVVRFVLLWVWSIIGWTPVARMQRRKRKALRQINRIARLTKKKQRTIGELYLSGASITVGTLKDMDNLIRAARQRGMSPKQLQALLVAIKDYQFVITALLDKTASDILSLGGQGDEYSSR